MQSFYLEIDDSLVFNYLHFNPSSCWHLLESKTVAAIEEPLPSARFVHIYMLCKSMETLHRLCEMYSIEVNEWDELYENDGYDID